jgi:hypothetical protein
MRDTDMAGEGMGPSLLTRLPMVPVLSSAARMPLPGVAMALAVAISSAAYCSGRGRHPASEVDVGDGAAAS